MINAEKAKTTGIEKRKETPLSINIQEENFFVGRGGALVESMTFNRRVVGSTTVLAFYFFLTSSLHKQPFITAHFLHHCTLKQALQTTLLDKVVQRKLRWFGQKECLLTEFHFPFLHEKNPYFRK